MLVGNVLYASYMLHVAYPALSRRVERWLIDQWERFQGWLDRWTWAERWRYKFEHELTAD
jgi:hypothetical protein